MSDSKTTGASQQQVIDLPVNFDRAEIVKEFKSERTRPAMEKYLDELIPMVKEVVQAKAVYRVCCVTSRSADGVEIEGIKFPSKVLAGALAEVDTVIVTLMTCGKELDELPVSPKEFMKYFCLEAIKTYILFQTGQYLVEYIRDKYKLPDVTHLHPGEFADLGIEQQVPLFALFDDPEKAIGIKLTPNKTLSPLKSASSIMFYNGPSFQSCELCLQANCAGRRKPYSPKLAEKFGIKVKK